MIDTMFQLRGKEEIRWDRVEYHHVSREGILSIADVRICRNLVNTFDLGTAEASGYSSTFLEVRAYGIAPWDHTRIWRQQEDFSN